MAKLLAAATGAALLTPAAGLLALVVLLSPGLDATAGCATSDIQLSPTVPARLSVPAPGGGTTLLDASQLARAATIIQTGAAIPGVGTQGAEVALMAALTESGLQMLANTTAYPQSAQYPNDGDGHDHDSLGLFQMRPSTGWGTVTQLMNPSYDAQAFYGGPAGPNHGSPAGLLDHPGWAAMPPGQAAQDVEVSAYPDRYAAWQPAAATIVAKLTTRASSAAMPETTALSFPLPANTYTVSAPFGERINPITGRPEFHEGVDLAAPLGTPILALAGGTVTYAGLAGGIQGEIDITSTIDGQPVQTRYLHMFQNGILVHAGQHVTAGQQIGAVGTSGESTGPHLHFEIHPGAHPPPPSTPSPGFPCMTSPRQLPLPAGQQYAMNRTEADHPRGPRRRA